MRPNPTLIPWVFVALMAGGCGSSQTTTRTTPTETPQQRSAASSTDRPGMSGMCPMKVTGTTVWAEDIEGGVALRFTTTGDVAELQSHLQRMAQMHNRQAADRRGRGPHEHGMHGHPEHAMMGGVPPRSDHVSS